MDYNEFDNVVSEGASEEEIQLIKDTSSVTQEFSLVQQDVTKDLASLTEQIGLSLQRVQELVCDDINKGNVEGIEAEIERLQNGFIDIIAQNEKSMNDRLDAIAKSIEDLKNRSLSAKISNGTKKMVSALGAGFVAFREKVKDAFSSIKETVTIAFEKTKENVKEYKENIKADYSAYKENMDILKGFKAEEKILVKGYDIDKMNLGVEAFTTFGQRAELLTALKEKIDEQIKEMKVPDKTKTVFGRIMNGKATRQIESLSNISACCAKIDVCLQKMQDKANACVEKVGSVIKSATDKVNEGFTAFTVGTAEKTSSLLSKIVDKCDNYIESKNNPEKNEVDNATMEVEKDDVDKE